MASRGREQTWMAHRVSVSSVVITGVRRIGVAGLLRNEALVKLNVRTFAERVGTTTANTRAPRERTP